MQLSKLSVLGSHWGALWDETENLLLWLGKHDEYYIWNRNLQHSLHEWRVEWKEGEIFLYLACIAICLDHTFVDLRPIPCRPALLARLPKYHSRHNHFHPLWSSVAIIGRSIQSRICQGHASYRLGGPVLGPYIESQCDWPNGQHHQRQDPVGPLWA